MSSVKQDKIWSWSERRNPSRYRSTTCLCRDSFFITRAPPTGTGTVRLSPPTSHIWNVAALQLAASRWLQGRGRRGPGRGVVRASQRYEVDHVRLWPARAGRDGERHRTGEVLRSSTAPPPRGPRAV